MTKCSQCGKDIPPGEARFPTYTVPYCADCATVHPGTQAAAVAAMAPGAMALAKPGPGGLYKPDASPTDLRCARCGRPAMWIAGAGEALCVRHQDDY